MALKHGANVAWILGVCFTNREIMLHELPERSGKHRTLYFFCGKMHSRKLVLFHPLLRASPTNNFENSFSVQLQNQLDVGRSFYYLNLEVN